MEEEEEGEDFSLRETLRDRAEFPLFSVKTNMSVRPVRQSLFTPDDARVVLASSRHAHTSRDQNMEYVEFSK